MAAWSTCRGDNILAETSGAAEQEFFADGLTRDCPAVTSGALL
jgi:hypothetical protein